MLKPSAAPSVNQSSIRSATCSGVPAKVKWPRATSIALSADGNIAIVGGFAEDGGVALVFTRGSGQWFQDKRLVGTVSR